MRINRSWKMMCVLCAFGALAPEPNEMLRCQQLRQLLLAQNKHLQEQELEWQKMMNDWS